MRLLTLHAARSLVASAWADEPIDQLRAEPYSADHADRTVVETAAGYRLPLPLWIVDQLEIPGTASTDTDVIFHINWFAV